MGYLLECAEFEWLMQVQQYIYLKDYRKQSVAVGPGAYAGGLPLPPMQHPKIRVFFPKNAVNQILKHDRN